ncbi:E3 ubiquitin-protein ligase DCST1 isoform X5 [Pseudorasbora parva]|uniref:E3 ubiquitin-protein ligase DCST1 isoform X5 n=1 Tax=Pseudorasbora parva TaxID=51549 RepID=UPI00351DB9B1
MDCFGETRCKTPHSALEQVCKHILPAGVHRFLFGPLSEFPMVRRLTGAVFGTLSGVGLFFGLMHNIAMTAVQRVVVGCVFVGLCTLGGIFSSLFRCSVLLMFPSMIGSQGRTFLMVFVLHGLYQGPIANIQRNVQDVASSMGCHIDLQITHSKVMWRMLTEPYVQVVKEIVSDSEEFEKESQNVSKTFQKIRDEVMGRYGYDSLGKESVHTANSTQEEYVEKTRSRCDYVVQQGIRRCQDWFSMKWEECMKTIQAPLINHFLCIPMQFHFLCNIMRVMTPWCTEKIPVEGNFGQTFDKLNDSINRLAEHFTTNLVLKNLEQQSVLGVNVLQNFSKELSRVFQEKIVIAEKIAGVINFLLSFTFITVFTSAFGYVRQFCRDIHFDNVYITTYFRQIDARRIRAGKRHLLPLKKAEQESLINPRSLSIHPSELMPVVYTNRLRRVITAFYFPKREKRRILFLYNLQIQKRISFISRQRHRLRYQKQTFVTVLLVLLALLKHVGCRLHRCWVCDKFVWQNQAVECSSVGCTVIYCKQCWTDLDNICYACLPHNQCGPQDNGFDSDVYYSC